MSDVPTDKTTESDASNSPSEPVEPKLSEGGKSAMRGDIDSSVQKDTQEKNSGEPPATGDKNQDGARLSAKDGEPSNSTDTTESPPLPRPYGRESTMVGRLIHPTEAGSPGKSAMQGLDQNFVPARTENELPAETPSHKKLVPNDQLVRDAEEARRAALEKDIIQSKEAFDDQRRLEAFKKASPADIDTLAASGDATQMQEAALNLMEMEALKPENWRQLSEGERLDSLKQVEAKMAEIQHRPPVELMVAQMKPGEYGAFDQKAGLININRTALRSNDVAEHTDTVVHEGRHAYQAYAIKTPGFHSDQQQVNAWAENFKDYKRADIYGQEEYLKQPIEADAWAYAGTIRQSVFGAN